MDNIIIFLLIVQFIATGVGAYFIAREAKKIEKAIGQAAAIGFLLPFVLYIIPYSMNPTAEKMVFFIEWMMYSLVANEIAAIPTAIVTSLLKR